jgi:hypothetical protein
MAIIPTLSFFFATQRLDCKLAPKVVSAWKDLAVFRQAFASLHAIELCLTGWVANGTCEPFFPQPETKFSLPIADSSNLHSGINIDYGIPADHIGSLMP